jgi:protein-S-isoprenylcysteine O-methyltransferase Ste14
VIPASKGWGPGTVLAGIVVTAAGELIRMWAVHYIGTISRTRSDRLGPLIAEGPFALVRNPLYLGNIALWVGFALTARLVWLAPVAALLLGAEYHAIVRWEEALLEARLGEAYRAYARRVPRWVPTIHHKGHNGHKGENVRSFSWADTLFSERGTLVAMGAGYLLLWLKAHF